MKAEFVVLTALVAFTSAASIDSKNDLVRSISSIARKSVENFRDRMPCGIPELGIPILAPLTIDRKEIEFTKEHSSVQSEVTQLRIDGLNLFDILKLTVNPITRRVTFNFFWNEITIKSEYKFEGILDKELISVDLVGEGDCLATLKGLDLQGNIKYAFGLIDKKVKLKEFKLIFKLDGAKTNITGIFGNGILNRKFNQIISELIPLAINNNADLITEIIESIVLANVNMVLDGIPPSDIVETILDGEEEECIPPENKII